MSANQQMLLVGGRQDPYWDNVVLLLQNGSGTDLSKYARSLTLTGQTLNSTAWQPGGLNTIQLTTTFLGTRGAVQWTFAPEMYFGSGEWTIEGDIKFDAVNANTEFHLYGDRAGAGGKVLGWRFPSGGSGGRMETYENNSSAHGIGPLGVVNGFGGYFSLQRIGDTLYQHIDGVVGATTVSLSPGFTFNTTPDANTPVIGYPPSTTALTGTTQYVGRYRITIGVARYGASNYTPPSGALPVG